MLPGQVVEFSGDLEEYGHWLLSQCPYFLEATEEEPTREVYDFIQNSPDLDAAAAAREQFAREQRELRAEHDRVMGRAEGE